MGRGRKPLPTKLKIVMGNPGKRPLNTEEPQSTPSELAVPDLIAADPVATKAYRDTGAELRTMGVMDKIDETALLMYAVAYSTYCRAVQALQTEPPLVTWGKGGQYPNPWFRIKAEAEITMERMMTQLGMTPSSRSKLKGGSGVASNGKGLLDQVVTGQPIEGEIKNWEPPRADVVG